MQLPQPAGYSLVIKQTLSKVKEFRVAKFSYNKKKLSGLK